jgi:hypothetical protein
VAAPGARSRPPRLDQGGRSTRSSGGGVNHQPELWNPSASINPSSINPSSINRASTHRFGRPLSAICQHARLATLDTAASRLHPSTPTSWDDVVPRIALWSIARGPHSLHTAEVTGSIPVTPTSHFCRPTRRRPSSHLSSGSLSLVLGHTWGMLASAVAMYCPMTVTTRACMAGVICR